MDEVWRLTVQKVIRLLLDRPIAFHRAFVTMSGSVTAALFLSQAVYWQNRMDGWFWKTQEQWEEETGLTRREQESARNRLKDLGVIREERRGNPAKLFFTVDFERVQTRLAENAILGCTETPHKNGEHRQPIKEAETTTEITAENIGQDTLPEFHSLEYARKLLEEINSPVTKQNNIAVSAALDSLVRSGKSKAAAYEFLLASASDAIERGERVDKFWFEDAKWRGVNGNGTRLSSQQQRTQRGRKAILDAAVSYARERAGTDQGKQ
jgi:hypothetical protein